MGIQMLDGRDFTERDEAGAPAVMIINETFARRFFGGASPIGRTVRIVRTTATIVAEVKDSKYDTPTEGATPYFYLPFRQRFAPGLNFAFLIKTAGDPMAVIPVLRREALVLNQDAVFQSVRLTDAVGYSLYAQKVAASLLTVVAALCVLLAAIGLYSVVSYAVSQRTQEFGIRMAMGATPVNLVRMVAQQTLLLVIPGLLVGIAAALAAFRLFSAMLVGVSPTDPVSIGSSAVFLVAIALLASCLPARRAARIDPMTALRYQ
jgi:ABC-type antimicrobial peptide transport system permease subunit